MYIEKLNVHEIMAAGTILNEVVSESKKHGYMVATFTILYDEVVYFATFINGKVVDFTDTSKSCR